MLAKGVSRLAGGEEREERKGEGMKTPIAGRHHSKDHEGIWAMDSDKTRFNGRMPDGRQTTRGRLMVLEVVEDVLNDKPMCWQNRKMKVKDYCTVCTWKNYRWDDDPCQNEHRISKVRLARWLIAQSKEEKT